MALGGCAVVGAAGVLELGEKNFVAGGRVLGSEDEIIGLERKSSGVMGMMRWSLGRVLVLVGVVVVRAIFRMLDSGADSLLGYYLVEYN
jgi:hypothetical protein